VVWRLVGRPEVRNVVSDPISSYYLPSYLELVGTAGNRIDTQVGGGGGKIGGVFIGRFPRIQCASRAQQKYSAVTLS